MGEPSYRTNTYALKFKPLLIKKLIVECDISQRDLMRLTGLAKATINLAVNRGYIPSRTPNFKEIIQDYLLMCPQSPAVVKWLKTHGRKIEDIWSELGAPMRNAAPRWESRNHQKPLVPGDPDSIIENKEVETEMLNSEAMRYFKLFKSPFMGDICEIKDIFLSDEHRYIETMMLDAARNGGFLAVIGEVGSGKSVIRKKVVAELNKDDNARIIYPRMIDKTRVTGASLCDAIILDLSEEAPKMRLEQKTRQVEKLLLSRSKAGCRVVLIIEEAHDLTVKVLKLLKRFHEIEDGYKKVLGIIIIAQPELGNLFNEADHYDMREVIRRCQLAQIKGLNGDLKDYLALKFKRVGVELKNIITDEAIKELSKRLKARDMRGKEFSNAYPLTVNNHIMRAMNLAYEMGEQKVTEAVIQAL